MLLHLYELIAGSGSGAFPGPGLRAACAALTAWVAALCIGRWWIDLIHRRAWTERVKKGDSARLDGLHAHKRGTPTLGGLILLGGLFASAALWARWEAASIWLLAGGTLAYGALGFADDWVKLRRGRKGLTARRKLAAQVLLAALAGLCLQAMPPETVAGGGRAVPWTGLSLPWAPGAVLALGGAHVALVVLVVTGSSNAVNLTDGLDGLAAGCGVLAAGGLAVLAWVAGDAAASAGLGLLRVEGASEAAVFAGALAGSGLGFLWYNAHPARIFMGDTGSLALGGALGLLAVLAKQELLFLLLGGVFVAEAMSVLLQVGSFKLWGRRIFLIAPLHHHFQFLGWEESEVTVRFWIAAAVCVLLSLGTLAL